MKVLFMLQIKQKQWRTHTETKHSVSACKCMQMEPIYFWIDVVAFGGVQNWTKVVNEIEWNKMKCK